VSEAHQDARPPGRPGLRRRRAARLLRRCTMLVVAGLLVAGCASADKDAATSGSNTGSGSMPGMNMSGSSTMSGPSKDVNGGRVTAARVGGLNVIPTTVLGSTTWQGMRITAWARTSLPFLVYDGTSTHEVKPGKNSSFHLMVMLSDAHTGVAIPYAGVWATIRKDGKVVYDERQWPMIAEYMGPHYGSDIALPANGTYEMSLLISPPVSARHMEYAHVWMHPHHVNFTFHWRHTTA
jgi:Fe2+ transport protein